MSMQIFALIPKIMAEVGAISKDRKNLSQGYAFRGIDDLYAALQGPLAKHGVFYAPEVLTESREERLTKAGGNMIYTVLKVKFVFYGPDASSFAVTTVGEAMDSGDKSANKAMSAALKYALLQLFCIPTEDDNDSENTSPETLPRHPANQGPRPAPPRAVQGPKPIIPNAFAKPEAGAKPHIASCSNCGSDLVKSATTTAWRCPNYADKSRGPHTYVP